MLHVSAHAASKGEEEGKKVLPWDVALIDKNEINPSNLTCHTTHIRVYVRTYVVFPSSRLPSDLNANQLRNKEIKQKEIETS